MKILFVSDANSIGGAEKYLVMLIESLNIRHEIHVLCRPHISLLFENIRGVRCVWKSGGDNVQKTGFSKEIDKISFLLSARKIIKIIKPNIIHVNITFWGRNAFIISSLHLIIKDADIVATCHLTEKKHKWGWRLYRKYLFRWAIFKGLRLIVISNFMKKLVAESLRVSDHSLFRIYNPLPHDNKSQNADITDLDDFIRDENSFLFLCASRIEKHQKDYQLLVEAVETLVAKRNDFIVVILGSGPFEAELKTIIERKNLNTYIKLLGFRSNVKSFLHQADAFILPTKFEGFPLVLLEALAIGIPCLTSDVCANNELVRHGHNGYLYDDGSSNSMVEMMVLLMDNNLKPLEDFGLDEFDYSQFINATEKVLVG